MSPPLLPKNYQGKEQPKSKGLFGSLFGKEKVDDPNLIASYSVIYLGGHPDYPKPKVAKITFNIFQDRFELLPTMTSKAWFNGLVIPFASIANLEIVQRQIGTVEGLLGGINSRQLNQPNNIHIIYCTDSLEIVLRLEMLTGVTVMGQAVKCQELMDRLRTHQIFAKFQRRAGQPAASSNDANDIATQIEKLAGLRHKGILTQDEFERKKSDLLSRM